MSYPPTLKYLIIAYSTMQTDAPINECIGFHSFGPIGIAVGNANAHSPSSALAVELVELSSLALSSFENIDKQSI